MPMSLSITQRKAFVSAALSVSKTGKWFPAFNRKKPKRWTKDNAFGKWLDNKSTSPSRFNCWEAVLLAGFKAGLWGKDYIERAIEVVPYYDSALRVNRLVGFMREQDVAKDGRFAGNIVMFGKLGEHFAVSDGLGNLIEIDKARSGRIPTSELRQISPYRNHVIHVGDPPTLEELGYVGT